MRASAEFRSVMSSITTTDPLPSLNPAALNPANTLAPSDSSSASLLILGSQLCRAGNPCLNAANPRFTYSIEGYDLFDGSADIVPGSASFNPYTPSITNGDFLAAIAPE